MQPWVRVLVSAVCLAGAVPVAGAADAAKPASLADALAVLKAHRFVDLTHSFAPGIPHWKGAPD